MCAICGKPATGQDYIGRISACSACAKIWADAKTNARLVVGLDHDLESDERLVACRTALEAARKELTDYKARFNQHRFGDD